MSRAWRLSLCSLAAAAALTCGQAGAQGISINSSPTPVGSGARALGMGSAFVAIADDATASSWNPGGLTQLERPEISLVFSYKVFSEEWKQTSHVFPDDDKFDVDFTDLNYFSIAYPIPWTLGGRNFVISLNYQKQLDFNRDLNLRASDIPGPPFIPIIQTNFDIDYTQSGSLATISPAIGFEITDRLSMGIAMNLWDSDLVPGNEWKTRNDFKVRANLAGGGSPFYSAGSIDEDFDDYKATNFTIGLLYKPTERWSVGLVHHTHYNAEYDYRKITRTKFPSIFPVSPNFAPVSITRRHQTIEWPSATALGVAYRFPNDKLTLSLDVTYRDWDSYVKTDPLGGLKGHRVSPVTGLPKTLSPHDPTWTVRLGGEYVFVDETKPIQNFLPSLRAGIFYDPQPAGGREDTFFGTKRKGAGDPDDYYGIALGAGVLIKNRVNIDFAYQYRFGTNVNKDTFAGSSPFEDDFHEDVHQHLFYLSTVIYF